MTLINILGFLHDITGEIQNQNQPSDSENKPVLPWKCIGSSSFMGKFICISVC